MGKNKTKTDTCKHKVGKKAFCLQALLKRRHKDSVCHVLRDNYISNLSTKSEVTGLWHNTWCAHKQQLANSRICSWC